MFAVNGNRPGPNPNGQSYGEILRAAKLEEQAANAPSRITPASDHNGDDLEPLGVRSDRIIVQSEFGPYDFPNVKVFDTSRGTLGFAFGSVSIQH